MDVDILQSWIILEVNGYHEIKTKKSVKFSPQWDLNCVPMEPKDSELPMSHIECLQTKWLPHNFFLFFADGLTDCSDSKCCSHDSCKKSIMCLYLADPVEVLLRKPPPTVTASFLKRVQFLFEGEESVQNYAKQDVFDEK